MFISFITKSSYIESPFFKILLSWRIEFLLLCLILLFIACIYYIRSLFVERKSKGRLATNHQSVLQSSVSQRRRLASKSVKIKKRKSSRQMSSKVMTKDFQIFSVVR